ncbi:TetR/AcrR family transcriptional regulator [Rhodococcus rhodnii]|uniref:Transcriptional regulator n=2 Tax=Rhodococcus rhodnii TaxID=38312 RepID=R7WN08_9NOCA|nr:TetR/AcrR family transcriptional regulator [Rhodococcus rhodnii]EOM76680.1 transcriptional regulator [Rhodococcus rhodnii LMG 5362]TXG92915.1 TetR/AcrR family transcriptional regulator [Rhodococcus rhodnii]
MSSDGATDETTSEPSTNGDTPPPAKPDAPAKSDGRKRRWREHKIARREELVDGTISAIRLHGRDIGMDEIASEIGVSKTVLYRYFSDKSDLMNATMMRYVQTTLAPRVYAAVSSDMSEFELTEATIKAYVETVASDPEIYLYVMSNGQGADTSVVADSERMIAEVLASVLGEKLRALDMDSGGSVPWAYGVVGSVQLATHWWISNRSMSTEDLIAYLTMMLWGGISGIAEMKGSPTRFRAADHSFPTGPET